MKKIIFCFFAIIFFCVSCDSKTNLSERNTFIQKVEAFRFLSEYHHQLHIMIGEDEGDGDLAFKEFSDAIGKIRNVELVPVVNSFNRIKEFSIASEAVMKLDHLIDYYQSGLSLQVEAVLRGYGYFDTFPIDSALFIYDRLQNES
jgi:hypothetical protein|tara:strand:+ start:90 stop:524 length:435 start_codon:yes stop_codon:yes gene_type:complete